MLPIGPGVSTLALKRSSSSWVSGVSGGAVSSTVGAALTDASSERTTATSLNCILSVVECWWDGVCPEV